MADAAGPSSSRPDLMELWETSEQTYKTLIDKTKQSVDMCDNFNYIVGISPQANMENRHDMEYVIDDDMRKLLSWCNLRLHSEASPEISHRVAFRNRKPDDPLVLIRRAWRELHTAWHNLSQRFEILAQLHGNQYVPHGSFERTYLSHSYYKVYNRMLELSIKYRDMMFWKEPGCVHEYAHVFAVLEDLRLGKYILEDRRNKVLAMAGKLARYGCEEIEGFVSPTEAVESINSQWLSLSKLELLAREHLRPHDSVLCTDPHACVSEWGQEYTASNPLADRGTWRVRRFVTHNIECMCQFCADPSSGGSQR
jgi:hypothetical protein